MLKKIKNLLFRKISKAVVDILLVAGLVITMISGWTAEDSWWTFHCIASMIWYLLMIIHIWQHWGMTKAVFKWKVLKKNKITFLTVISFILITLSIILFIVNINEQFVHFHHVVASVLEKIVIIHMIITVRKFMALFRQNPKLRPLRLTKN